MAGRQQLFIHSVTVKDPLLQLYVLASISLEGTPASHGEVSDMIYFHCLSSIPGN